MTSDLTTPTTGRSTGKTRSTKSVSHRRLAVLLFVALLVAFAAGIWGTIIRPPAYEVRGTIVARPAPDLLLVRHDPVSALGMNAMDLIGNRQNDGLVSSSSASKNCEA